MAAQHRQDVPERATSSSFALSISPIGTPTPTLLVSQADRNADISVSRSIRVRGRKTAWLESSGKALKATRSLDPDPDPNPDHNPDRRQIDVPPARCADPPRSRGPLVDFQSLARYRYNLSHWIPCHTTIRALRGGQPRWGRSGSRGRSCRRGDEAYTNTVPLSHHGGRRGTCV